MPRGLFSRARVRFKPRALRAAAVGMGVAGLMLCQVTLAQAGWVYSEVINWNLTETANTYGSYNTSTGSTDIRYRWDDDPSHTTVIAANDCGTGALYGPTAEIPAHNTAFHVLGFPSGGSGCFNLRGRVAIGAGSMSNHDGTVGR